MKRIFLYIIFIFTCFTAAAQPGGERAEKIRALYVAYVTQQLTITSDEAQRFWPLHQQYESELRSINSAGYSELDRQQKQLDLKRRYQAPFAGVIGNERSNRFFAVSDSFMDKLTGRLKQMRQERKAEGLGGGTGGFKQGGGQFRERRVVPGKRENMITTPGNNRK